MAERVVLRLGDVEHELLVEPTRGTAPGVACPRCTEEPVAVAGHGARPHDRHDDPQDGFDYYVSDATCLACGERIGEIRAYVSSLFGLREDIAVLYGRPRVY